MNQKQDIYGPAFTKLLVQQSILISEEENFPELGPEQHIFKALTN